MASMVVTGQRSALSRAMFGSGPSRIRIQINCFRKSAGKVRQHLFIDLTIGIDDYADRFSVCGEGWPPTRRCLHTHIKDSRRLAWTRWPRQHLSPTVPRLKEASYPPPIELAHRTDRLLGIECTGTPHLLVYTIPKRAGLTSPGSTVTLSHVGGDTQTRLRLCYDSAGPTPN